MLDKNVPLSLLFMILIAMFQVWISSIDLHPDAKRRWQHALTGHALVEISKVLPSSFCIASLTIMLLFIYYFVKFHPDTYRKLVGPILRPHELQSLPAAFYFLLGTLLTALLVPWDVGRYAIDCLSFADPMASWIGSSIKSPSIHTSASIAGSMACFLTALVVGLLVLPDFPFYSIATGAFFCTFAEAMSFGYDNLAIPLVTATAVQATQMLR